jgi:hypothetical protein
VPALRDSLDPDENVDELVPVHREVHGVLFLFLEIKKTVVIEGAVETVEFRRGEAPFAERRCGGKVDE